LPSPYPHFKGHLNLPPSRLKLDCQQDWQTMSSQQGITTGLRVYRLKYFLQFSQRREEFIFIIYIFL
jgi:hypothetical protein